MVLALTQTAIGVVVLFIVVVLAAAYAFINVRASRKEVGSEIELAANRKEYYDDEELEGSKLDRTLTFGLLGLFVVAIALPLYWLNEPGRQDGAEENFKEEFETQGAELFATTEEGGFNCAFCHGGMEAEGGEVDHTITDANGAFVKQVQWRAPALNTVLLRYSREEVRWILTYGRPYSPMPAWGVDGGGPMNDQQIQTLIDYLSTIQLTPEESQAQVTEELATLREETLPDGSLKYPPSVSDGELLFNLGYEDGFAGGAYACARCHTSGWSYGEKGPDGDGAYAPKLRGGRTTYLFPGAVQGPTQMTDFVCAGTEEGQQYGTNGQSSAGQMPGFCQVPARNGNQAQTGEVGVTDRDPSDPMTEGGMLSYEQVQAIVEYERGL